MSLIFGLAHGLNPEVTPLAIGNMALAGVFLEPGVLRAGRDLDRVGRAPRMERHARGARRAGQRPPVSHSPHQLRPRHDAPWLTGGSFGPEGGVAATVVLCIGCVVLARFARKDDAA